ncbi:MAG: response regulator [Pseudobdellovibrionaceae bacterium]
MEQPLIAVVDDEVDLLDNFQSLLQDQFQVRTFSSPQSFLQALPELQSQKLRLLISDFKMPGMSGLAMVQQAHLVYPNLPFIILSGFLDKKAVLDAVDLGVFRLLEKPCPPDELLSSVDQLLVEADLHLVRKEIRQITSQLRELYSTIRIALLQYIPEELLGRMVIDAPSEGEDRKMGFDDLLESLEHRLDHLLTSEKVMHDLTHHRAKKPIS